MLKIDRKWNVSSNTTSRSKDVLSAVAHVRPMPTTEKADLTGAASQSVLARRGALRPVATVGYRG
jgi:hypothetical protein